jgi:hypothetical protein
MKKLVLVAIAALMPTEASAITYAEWAMLSENTRNAFIAGMSDGMGWVNVSVRQDHNVAAYCPPQAIGFSPAQHIDLLNDYVARFPDTPDDQEVGALMLLALKEAFPC